MDQNGALADVVRGVSTAERKAAMSADILRRKLRNFPLGNLGERIATAS